jgi:hypothetical protein
MSDLSNASWVVASILGLAALYFAAARHFRERLKVNESYRRARAEDLRHPGLTRLYEGLLHRALELLWTLMGAPWSLLAFFVCLTIGLFYSVLLLIVSWSFFGATAEFGQTALLPDWHVARRALLGIGALTLLLAAYYISWKFCRWTRGHDKVETAEVVIVFGLLGSLVASGVANEFGLLAVALGVVICFLILFIIVYGISAPGIAVFGITAAVVTVVMVVLGSISDPEIDIAVRGYAHLNTKKDSAVHGMVLFWVILPLINAAGGLALMVGEPWAGPSFAEYYSKTARFGPAQDLGRILACGARLLAGDRISGPGRAYAAVGRRAVQPLDPMAWRHCSVRPERLPLRCRARSLEHRALGDSHASQHLGPHRAARGRRVGDAACRGCAMAAAGRNARAAARDRGAGLTRI